MGFNPGSIRPQPAPTMGRQTDRPQLPMTAPPPSSKTAPSPAPRYTSRIFQGHSAPVTSVAFSPDGSRIVSGSDDKTIRLWDLQGNPMGKRVWGSGNVYSSVCSVAFSPDGSRIVSGGSAKTIRLWDLQGNPILEGEPFQGHSDYYVTSVAFSPDGSCIVSGSKDKTIRLWDLQGNPIGEPFQGHSDAVESVAFSPDGSRIVSGSGDNTIRLWDLQGNPIGEPFQGHSDRVRSVAFSPDGSRIVSGSGDKTIRLWGKVGTLAVPQSLSNDLAEGEDRLLIQDELDALTSILMLRQLQPPLAVGILGSWGSGKSFAMHLMQQRINAIRSQPLQSAQAWGDDRELRSPYVGHIYQIRFDAWSYAKANLWASLMETIFQELNRQISLEQQLEQAGVNQLQGGDIWQALNTMGEEQRRALLENHLSPRLWQDWQAITNQRTAALWQHLDRLQTQEGEDLKTAEKTVAELEAQLQQQMAEIEAEADRELLKIACKEAMKPMKETWQDLLGQGADDLRDKLLAADPVKTAEVKAVLEELQPDFWRSVIKTYRQNPWLVLGFLVAVVLALSTPLLVDGLAGWGGRIGERFMAVMANTPLVAAGIPLYQKARTIWKQHRRKVQELWVQYQARLQAHQDQLVSYRQSLIDAQRAEKTKDLEQKINKKKAELAERRNHISLAGDYSSLTEFVSDRLQSNPYQEQLGIIHQVRQDIEALSDRLVINPDDSPDLQAQKQQLFPRGEARVVLYIDDLDRCPPDRVVEVLEAIQLLVKTKLFIVVVAIDDRYIARALEDVYQGVLKRRGKPSGMDYLEKIIQIPYRMRPISPLNVESYLASQVDYRRDEGATATAIGMMAKGGRSPFPAPATPEGIDPLPHAQSLAQQTQQIQQQTQQFQQSVQDQVQQSLLPWTNADLGQQSLDSQGFSQQGFSQQGFSQQGLGQYQQMEQTSLTLPDEVPVPDLPLRADDSYLETIAEVTVLDQAEFELLVTCCNYVDITPRTAKRLINIYKILKAIWAKRGEPDAESKRVVMVFLALSGRYPDFMRDLFGELDTCFEETAIEARDQSLTVNWQDISPSLKPAPGTVDPHVLREWRRFESDLKNTLGFRFRVDRATFYLTLSFCFVGDIGYDPADFTGYGVPDPPAPATP